MEKDIKGNKMLIISIIVVLFIIILGLFLLYKKNSIGRKIGLDEDVIYMKVGDIRLLPYKEEKITDKEIIFESSDPSIAKIDNQGYIYAYKVGSVTIKTYYANSSSFSYCTVIVTKEGGGNPTKIDEGNDDSPPPQDTPQSVNASCKLAVSEDGIITATIKNAVRYGFDKKNMDSMELTKHVDDISNKEEKDVEGWNYFRIRYYVENEEKTVKSCSIVVIKKCDSLNKCTYEKN